MVTLTRIVLAAGASTRMGRTKALLPLGDRSALGHIAARHGDARISETLVVVGHDAQAVAAEAVRLGLFPVNHPTWERGQTSSLKAGLLAVPAGRTGVILHPVDVPLAAESTYDACHAAFIAAQVAGSPCIVVPSWKMRRGHPVYMPVALAREWLAFADDEPARRLLQTHAADIRHVEVDDPWCVQDLDTPDDWARAMREF